MRKRREVPGTVVARYFSARAHHLARPTATADEDQQRGEHPYRMSLVAVGDVPSVSAPADDKVTVS
jgi:hypothetical protein